jgi:hypothetical protein
LDKAIGQRKLILQNALWKPTTWRYILGNRQGPRRRGNPMKAKPDMPQYDVFLSYSSIDKIWVTKLKDDLICYGVSVWLDKDEIRPGDLFAEALERALDNCRAVALIVSPEAIASGWVKEEYYRALSLTKARQVNLQLIPVILRDAELPGFLAGRNWVDFRNETAYVQRVWELVWGITGQKPAQILDLSQPGSASTVPAPPASQTEVRTYVTFIHSGPVPPSHFIGRKREVVRILSQLANPARGSSAISGDPRVGKTSLLHYLCEPQVSEGWRLSSTWCHFLYIDCQNIAPFSEEAFWHFTLRELEQHLRDDKVLNRRVQWLIEQSSPDIFDINSLFDEITRANRLVVLMLDEFEWIVENLDPNSPGLLNHLRALLNRPRRGLALLIATRAPLEQLCAGFRFKGSPFDNAFSAITLLPFSKVEVDELLDRYQANLSPTERNYLLQMAGTHPYLVQLTAWLIVRARGGQAEIEIPLAPNEAELEQETEGYFSDMFRYSSQAEQMLLTWLALCPLSQHLPAVQTRLGSPTRAFGRYEQVLEHLVKRGLVLKQTEGPILFSPIFARWILHQVIIAGGQDVLSRWEPLYANFLSLTQKEALEDLVDKVVRQPAAVKTPELLTQSLTQDEVSLPPNPAKQQVLGRYIVEEGIGGGGMADIFRAHDPHLERPVAVKRLRPALSGEEEVRARFQREAQALAGLRHPHIVQVYDFGIEDNHYYMVMEFIDGYDLKQHLNKLQAAGQTLSWEESLRIATCVAGALDYAHQRGMIHRDVKPSNILLTNDGGVFLTDFGLVRLLDQAGLTQTGGVVGTPAYMAPEQIMGQSQDIDHRVDIYALGCVVYEMITGGPPFDQADLPLAPLDKDPPAPSFIVPDLSEAASQTILKALAKDRAERPPSASQFIQDLRRALGI